MIIITIILVILFGILIYFLVIAPSQEVLGPTTSTDLPVTKIDQLNPGAVPNNSTQTSSLTGGTEVLRSGGNVIYTAIPSTGDITLFIPPSNQNTQGTLIRVNNDAPITSPYAITVVPQAGVTITAPNQSLRIEGGSHLTLVAEGLNRYRAIPAVDNTLYVFEGSNDPEFREFITLYEITETSNRYILKSPNGTYTFFQRIYQGRGDDAVATQRSGPAIRSGNIYTFELDGRRVNQAENSTTTVPAPPEATPARPLLGGFAIPGIVFAGSVLNNLAGRPVERAVEGVQQAITTVEEGIAAVTASIRTTLANIETAGANALTAISDFGNSVWSGITTAFKIIAIILAVLIIGIILYFIFLAFYYFISGIAALRVATSSKI